MAQPIFLKNFTLDGFDMGELFVTAQVTIPFLNVERSYFNVGNSDGKFLQNTRIESTEIKIDGFLIKDFSNLSISETKDQLVAQVMSKQTQRLVFDALPDRYFNVVFEGTQDYDATDDNLTPLTLTFSCPEGVAHSITPDVFRNVASTSANMLTDSNFETSTFWNNDAYVAPYTRNSANVLGLDYSDQEIENMDSAVNDFFADNVFHEDETMVKDKMYSFSLDYAVIKKSDLDDSNDGTFELVIDELDKINGKLLDSQTTALDYAPAGSSGQVATAYAYNATGTDRFTFEDNALPNMYPYGVSESPKLDTFSGSAVTTTLNQSIREWGATTAVRNVITGGTNTIKGRLVTGVLTVGGVTYTAQIYAKNNATTPVIINSNYGGALVLQPNESKLVSFTAQRAVGASAASLQLIIQTQNVADNVDVTLWRAKFSANTELDQWTEANQGTTDNTTPTYVGYSTTDIASAPSNLLLNGSLAESTNRWYVNGVGVTFTRDSLGFSTIDKTQATSGRSGVTTGTDYTLYGSVEQGKTYTLSLDIFVASLTSGAVTGSSAYMRITYADNSVLDINLNISQTIGSWQRLVGNTTIANKPISTITMNVQLAPNFVGKVHVKNVKLEEGSEATPFARHITERGLDYTWYAYGTGFDASTVPLQRGGIRYRVKNDASKVLRVSLNVYGNAHVIINRPNLEAEVNPTFRYIVSNKQNLQALPVTNYGTWKSYPTFEITNNNENGLIGIINENGEVLQFGNEGNVDGAPPTNDVFGLRETFRSSTRPSNFVINAGHVSNYPYAGNNPDTPNVVRGSYDFKPTEVTKPIMPNIGDTNSWQGPTLTSTITAPPSGNRTGAFVAEEVIVFNTDGDKRGRMEMVVITEANDILMGVTIRDSSTSANEIILEYWYGNKLLKTIKTDVSKYKSNSFRVTMMRDDSGKKFNWNFENIQYVKNEPYKVITKNPFTYTLPIANKASVVRTSRWLMKWREGKSQKEVIDKTTYSLRTNNVLNIRGSATTNSKSYGTIAKGVSFDTSKMQRGQKIVKDNRWFYVSKNPSKGIPASGWVSAYHVKQLKVVETKRKVTFDSYSLMEIAGSFFTWVGTGKRKEAKNPFKAGDKVVINTYDKTIFVNGVERADLGAIGNMWSGFALEPGEHYLQFVNSDWSTNTMEVTVINHRTYL